MTNFMQITNPLNPKCVSPTHGMPSPRVPSIYNTTLIYRQYKCGCIAQNPSDNPIHRCSLWESRRPCKPKQLFSYLHVDCSVSCRWDIGNDRDQPQQEDCYLQNGSYQGEPSEEDYYFHRVPAQLNEPISVRKYRHGEATAARQRSIDSPGDRKVVAHGGGKETESSGGEDQALDLDSDIIVDESKPAEHHVSKANFGGRFARRKK
jgi:hypothetical protein